MSVRVSISSEPSACSGLMYCGVPMRARCSVKIVLSVRRWLVALRMQKAELDRDIERLQACVQTGQVTITPEKLKALSVAMQKRLAEGPPELRQAYMRLILDSVTIDHHDVRPSLLGDRQERGEHPRIVHCGRPSDDRSVGK